MERPITLPRSKRLTGQWLYRLLRDGENGVQLANRLPHLVQEQVPHVFGWTPVSAGGRDRHVQVCVVLVATCFGYRPYSCRGAVL